MGKKINLKLYDIDGCLYRKFLKPAPVDENIQTWLIESNHEFLKQQVKETCESQYDTLIVGYGTARQDNENDELNGTVNERNRFLFKDLLDPNDNINVFRGGSCIPAAPILQHYLAGSLPGKEVVFDPFLMSDIFSRLASPGKNYRGILAKLQGGPAPTDFWVADESKIAIIYAHAHRVASLNPEDEIDIDFYDDNPEILKNIFDAFNKHPDLLPKNVKLRLHQYSCHNPQSILQNTIPGTGETDLDYDWSVRYMAAQEYIVKKNMPTDKENTKDAAVLESYHSHARDGRYRNQALKMNGRKLNFEDFKQFRKNEIPKLKASQYGMIHKNDKNYLKAAQLVQQNKMPKQWLPITEIETRAAKKLYRVLGGKEFDCFYMKEFGINRIKEIETQVWNDGLEDYLKSLYVRSTINIKDYVYVLKTSDEKTISLSDDCPDLVQLFKNIASNDACWKTEGIHHLFSSQVPQGVRDIAKIETNKFSDIVSIVKARTSGFKGSFYGATKIRSEMTSEFYALILALDDKNVSDAVRTSAINTFCKSWKIPVPEAGPIAPQPIAVAK